VTNAFVRFTVALSDLTKCLRAIRDSPQER